MKNNWPALRHGLLLRSSRVLLSAGALTFLIGDAYLYEIKHVNFFVSTAEAVFAGLLLMLLGAVIAPPRNSRKPEVQ